MNKLFVLFLLFSLLQESVFATIIEGHNSEYAGEKLDFYQFADPVTKQKEFVFSLEFDGQGNCKTTIPVSKTTPLSCDFGIYKGMLFMGHSLGIESHERPYVSPYEEKILETGMVVCIEVPHRGTYVFNCEDEYLITQDGYKILTPHTSSGLEQV